MLLNQWKVESTVCFRAPAVSQSSKQNYAVLPHIQMHRIFFLKKSQTPMKQQQSEANEDAHDLVGVL